MAEDAIKLSWHQKCLADVSVLHHRKLLRLSLKLLQAAAIMKYSPAFMMQDHYVFTDMRRLTLRLLMSDIYGAPILDVSRSHTTTQHSR
jgi:hypothetical protein